MDRHKPSFSHVMAWQTLSTWFDSGWRQIATDCDGLQYHGRPTLAGEVEWTRPVDKLEGGGKTEGGRRKTEGDRGKIGLVEAIDGWMERRDAIKVILLYFIFNS